jgi:hypothetical protein
VLWRRVNMAQHFLLSAAARSLSAAKIMRVSDNELRVCAARSRRRSSVGGTRGVGRRLSLWRFHQGRSEPGLIIAARLAWSAWYDRCISVESGGFETIGSVIWSKVGAAGCVGAGDLRGVARYAGARLDDGGGVPRCQSWRHGLLRRMRGERADEDRPPEMTVRTNPWLDRRQ